MNLKEYREDKRINASLLKLFSGRDFDPYTAVYAMRNPKPASQAMSVGTVVHSYIENNGIDYDTTAIDEAYKTAKPKEKALELSVTMGRQVLDNCPGEIKSLLQCKDAKHENVVFRDDFKALIDLQVGGIGVDWKTTAQTTKREFEYDCIDFGYALQAYHYSMVAQLDEFYFVAVSKTAPHQLFTLQCTPQYLDFGRVLWEEAYDRYIKFKDLDIDNYKFEVLPLNPPLWYTEKENEY